MADQVPSAVIGKLGQACSYVGALPSVIYICCKFQDDLYKALVENVMSGGDSATRGMVIGIVLGAHLGEGSLPPIVSKMNKYSDINTMINQLLQNQ